jgi:hypothetical protein
MKRIEVDFNTLTSEPVGLVKLGQAGTPGGDDLPGLREGERVQLWEPGLEVEATIVFDAAACYWMAKPDETTWRELPLPPELQAELERA